MKPSEINNNTWKRLQQKANNNVENNRNNINLTNQRKPANLNSNKNPKTSFNNNYFPEVNWDEIESRDADSISDSDFNGNKKQSSSNKPRLYTFYDYINKNKQQPVQQEQQKQSTPLKTIPWFASNSETNNTSVSPLPQSYYITMPISSGFGGYTNTTRRRPPPKVHI